MLELANSKLIGELNKAKEELEKARDKVRSTKAELEMTMDERKQDDNSVNLCDQMASAAIDNIKVGVEARIDQACKKVKFDTCSGLLYTCG